MNKYRAKPSNGFPSKLENAVHEVLLLRQLTGEITDIKRQQTVVLSDAKISYRADFSYVSRVSGLTVWVEAKGFPTDVWKLKKRLWAAYGPGALEIYQGSYTKPKLVEVIKPCLVR